MKLSEVKPNMHKQVRYDGSKYKLTHCVLSFNEITKKFGYSVILLDTRCVIVQKEWLTTF